jgi:predicted dinucleotide-binding enzyme
VSEQLYRDAGYEPVYAGPLENAAAQETSPVLSCMGSARRNGPIPVSDSAS